jgi:hypothetical protein
MSPRSVWLIEVRRRGTSDSFAFDTLEVIVEADMAQVTVTRSNERFPEFEHRAIEYIRKEPEHAETHVK